MCFVYKLRSISHLKSTTMTSKCKDIFFYVFCEAHVRAGFCEIFDKSWLWTLGHFFSWLLTPQIHTNPKMATDFSLFRHQVAGHCPLLWHSKAIYKPCCQGEAEFYHHLSDNFPELVYDFDFPERSLFFLTINYFTLYLQIKMSNDWFLDII